MQRAGPVHVDLGGEEVEVECRSRDGDSGSVYELVVRTAAGQTVSIGLHSHAQAIAIGQAALQIGLKLSSEPA